MNSVWIGKVKGRGKERDGKQSSTGPTSPILTRGKTNPTNSDLQSNKYDGDSSSIYIFFLGKLFF